MQRFYIDTSIWLNLFKREGDASRGKPYWQIADEFLRKAAAEEAQIFCSRIVRRELQLILNKAEFNRAKNLLDDCDELELSDEDVKIARRIESEERFMISFYDILHMLLAKRADAILITRDRGLIHLCTERGVVCKRPEEL